MTLPLTEWQLLTLERCHDLRGWHTYETGTHLGILSKPKEICVLSDPFYLLPWSYLFYDSAFCCLCLCFSLPPLHNAKLASLAKGCEMVCILVQVTRNLSNYPGGAMSRDPYRPETRAGTAVSASESERGFWLLFAWAEEQTAGFPLTPPGASHKLHISKHKTSKDTVGGRRGEATL